MAIDASSIVRRCERAVVTAYRELRVTGNDDLSAFRACTTLYRVHHPEASVRRPAGWSPNGSTTTSSAAKPGPTPGCDCD